MHSLTKHLLLLSLSHTILMTPQLRAHAVSPTTSSLIAANTQKTPQRQKAIAFIPPSTWMVADAKQLPPSVKAMVVGQGKTAFPPSINLGLEAYNGSLKQYIKTIEAINGSQGSRWKDLGTLKTAAGTGRLYQEDSTTKWGEVRMMHLILQQESTIYMMTAAATKEEFPTFYRHFFEAMHSLHFIEDGSSQLSASL